MTFYFNELSLHNQFHSSEQFMGSLISLIRCKEMLRHHQFGLNCSRLALGNRLVLNGLNFRRAVGNIQDRDLKRIILRWVDQEGPFWDDDQNRVHNPSDYFSNGAEEIVTDTALAEAAFSTWEGQNTPVISFKPSNYTLTPIMISWYRATEERFDISINNYWEIIDLEKLLETLMIPIQSWEQLENQIVDENNNLVFLPGFENGLKGQPFNSTIAMHIVQLLSILNEMKCCFNHNGERSPRGHELYQNYFTGDNSKFSDESSTNKEKFRRELTFPDQNGDPIYCPYHGKVSHQYFRIHFSWPISKDKNIYIAYIGPKITRG